MISVLHVVSVDKENYYLNNLVDQTPAGEVEHSFVTLAGECDFARSLRGRGQKVECLNAMSRASYPRAARALWKILKAEDPDIVHTHLFEPSLIGLTLAKWQGRKTVLTRHHSDAIHQLASPMKRRFYLALERYINTRADHIIAPSQMVCEYLVEREGVAASKVSVIPYGQTTERFDAVTPEKIAAVRSELGMDGRIAVANVSRLYHRKGHVYLFQAFADLVRGGLDAHLYLVGAGEYRRELEKMSADLGIAERVRFLGWRDDALAIVAASDVVVHPSLEDALSSAVIEAVMLKKPIVATDISGVRDSLDNGKFGRIVPPADAAALREALKYTIDNIGAAENNATRGREYLLR
jgi:glycosyltransferase involved in cell wall biosynthesis